MTTAFDRRDRDRRAYVCLQPPQSLEVVTAGYCALAASAVAPDAAPGRFLRNLPDPIPVAVLGRPAIARSHQRHVLGRAMFHDAARRVVHAAESIGIRGLRVAMA